MPDTIIRFDPGTGVQSMLTTGGLLTDIKGLVVNDEGFCVRLKQHLYYPNQSPNWCPNGACNCFLIVTT